MAWCPKCKSEYVEGVERCSDCDCELVEALEEIQEMTSWEKEIAARAGIMQQMEETEENQEPTEKSVFTGVYVNHSERAEENRTSAYTLLLVGAIGFVLVILFFLDLLPIHMTVISKYMISGVMGVMFILFIIMGIISMKNYRILEKKAKTENNLTQEIRKWCLENITATKIDSEFDGTEVVEEELKYFGRVDRMKCLIQNQFMNLDEAYLERLIDEIYPEIFEKCQDS